jgi:NAD(P)-dependent dehydrogenase (short-subunit alcohol dehydrogenase family)
VSDKLTVLISGAAAGIGRRIAERFLERGDAVHICDSSQEAVDTFLAANPTATATLADVADRSSVDGVFADLLEQHGGLDLLVNNAGIAGPGGPVETLDEDGWDECLQINLSGTFYMTKRAVPLLRKSTQASIINIASTAALMGCPQRSPYVATKWAQIGLTKTWAMELGPEGIRVNAVCPTSVDGARIDRVIEGEAKQRGLSAGEVREVYLRQTSMRSFATPDEVADTVLFLASDQAKRISGQALAVDGHTEGFLNWLDQ